MIVCSENLTKIILSYTSSGYITEPSIVLDNSILTMNSNGGHFDLFLKKSKKVKKYSKKEILWHGVILCVLVFRENNKHELVG